MPKPEGALHRAPRPLIMWSAVILIAGVTVFILVVLTALAVGIWLTAGKGNEPLNLTGTVGVIFGGIASIGPFIWQVLSQRHRERMDQQARGLPPGGAPFDSSPPFEGVNPHGGPNAP